MLAPRGITLRVALLGWLVALLTLTVFVIGIIPQQKREFTMNLDSKARGVAASIKAVAAGAAVSEDYSAVVEQAMQVLSGDDAIDFVVITKNDGFSVITDRSNWKTQTLGGEWRPARREPVSSIGTAPLFGRRVFRYATPFDYSGIEWGWVHIGLSLKDYDRSSTRSYQRTIALALFCGLMSLLVSLLYSRRLVKPIQVLHEAVEKVARGDLEARAAVSTSDEIGHLAGAFNSMTSTILARNRILESVGFAAQELLQAPDWLAAMERILPHMGLATGTSRAYVFENQQIGGVLCCNMRQEWAAPGITPAHDRWQSFPWKGGGLEELAAKLAATEIVQCTASQMSAAERATLAADIRSLIAIPVVVGGAWWGLLGFDDCVHERQWSKAEEESLRAVANMLGSAVIRRRAQDELIEANDTLERRVVERTQELREQIAERERAHADLAAAQQQLIDLSRQAGMAEVATGVLHNVGNVLNSVNVATTLVLEKVKQSRVDRLASVVGLLQEHRQDAGAFLQSDEKGRQVVPYLAKLSEHFARERDGMLTELDNLCRHVGHIKEIVAAQQGYATTAGLHEKVSVPALMENVLRLARDGLDRHRITVRLEQEELPEVLTDKHKVLQIVLNLVSNAKDATAAMSGSDREIRLRVGLCGDGEFEIVVADHGIGLRPEDLKRIFQHGFTTKANGHGFGLHSSALAAKDLGGSLSVASAGPGQGATFTLRLPLRAPGGSEERKTRHGSR